MMLRQSASIAVTDLRSLPRRLGSSLVIIVGIAGVVAVWVLLLSLASGFEATMQSTARPDRGMVLRNGSTRTLTSYFSGQAVDRIQAMEGVRRASGELLLTAHVPRHGEPRPADLLIRAVDGNGLAMRPEVRIVRGRPFEPGKFEVVVGRGLLRDHAGLDIGSRVPFLNGALEVVGHFESGGTLNESEMLMDLAAGRSAYRRGNAVNGVRVQLDHPDDAGPLQARLDADPELDLWLLSEDELLAEQSERRTGLIETFAYWIVGIMAVGGIAAALATMYAAVNQRTVEIAVLRAIGFGQASIMASVLLEAAVLALLGAGIGGTVVYLLFDGAHASTTNPVGGTAIAFAFAVTPPVVLAGTAIGLVLGVTGGAIAAIQAIRRPITHGLS